MTLVDPITPDLTKELRKDIDEAAEANAMEPKRWLEQVLREEVEKRKHPGYHTKKHRVFPVLVRLHDAKKTRTLNDMARDAAVSPTAFLDVLRIAGVKVGADDSISYGPKDIERMRDALQQSARLDDEPG